MNDVKPLYNEPIRDGYLRVSQILSPFSGLGNISKEVLDNAAERGTRVHAACDAIVEGSDFDDYEDTDVGYINSFKTWAKDKSFLKKPGRLYCDQLKITGEIDLLYEGPNGIVLVDLKTPARPSKTWPMQGTAYVYLLIKGGFNISEIEFVRLKKDGKPPTSYIYEEDLEGFMECYNIYHRFFYNQKFACESDFI